MTELTPRNICKIALFCVVFIILLATASAMCDPVAWFDDFRVQNRNARITEMMKQDSHTVDVINMGDSLSLASLTPMEMWRQRGYTSFNIGADGIRMPEAYYTIKMACKEQDIKYLFFETLPLFRYSEKQDMQMILSQPMYYLSTLLKYHSIWKPYVEGRGVRIYHKGYLINRYIAPYKGEMDYLDQELYDVNVEIPQFNRIWFEKTKEFCEKNNIRIILYSVASPKNYNWERINSVTEFAAEEGIEYIDLNQLPDVTGIDWKTDSNDGGDHLNLNGVIKMTTFFGDFLAAQGDLTDHRGDPAYSSWDEELVAYDALVEQMEGISFWDIQRRVQEERKKEKEAAKQE